MGDFCKVCGADTYICQKCGRESCSDEQPAKWTRWGNFCPGCAKPQKCSICGQKYVGYGNNAYPVNSGRCCDACNMTAVIPARLKALRV